MQRILWSGTLHGAPFFYPATLALVDHAMRSCFALLAAPLVEEVTIQWQLNQRDGTWEITVRWEDTASGEPRGLLMIDTEAPLNAAVTALLEAARQPPRLPLPSPVYEPSYCTWYAFHADLRQAEVEAHAREAAALGFGAFILDDGWMYPQEQRLSGALGRWHRFHGDATPAQEKFPDFDGFFATLEALGLRKILWVAPMIVGEESLLYRTLGERLLPSWLEEGFALLNPRDREAAGLVEEKLVGLAQRYRLDGFKADYDYALFGPGQQSYRLGPAYAATLEGWIRAVRAVRPELEWILSPGGFGPAVTGTFRCADVPFDPESNRLSLVSFKALMGKQPMHYDPSLWRADDALPTVYRHLLPSLFCIPSLGSDLLALPPEHREAIAATLAFYRRHQPLLNHGGFEARWHGGDYQSFHTRLGAREIAAAFSRYPVAITTEETRLLNASYGGELLLELSQPARLEMETLRGEIATPARTLAAGLQRVEVPPGGVLALTLS